MALETEAERIEKYRFDDFDLLPKQRLLLREGARIPLTPRPLATLLLLVERSGQTVSKDELFARVWNGAEVEENNLTQSISTLRRVLGERRGENRYIATDPGRGYRFVAPVSRVLEETASNAPEMEAVEEAGTGRFGGRGRLLVRIAGIVLLAAGLAVWFWRTTPWHPRPYASQSRFCVCGTYLRHRPNRGYKRRCRRCWHRNSPPEGSCGRFPPKTFPAGARIWVRPPTTNPKQPCSIRRKTIWGPTCSWWVPTS